MKEHKPIDPQFQIQLEAEFERLTSLQSDCWQTELEKRTDLTEKVKSALLELLKAHDTMPMRFMDSEVIREMYDQANLKSDEDVASTSPPSFENGTLIGSYRLEIEIGHSREHGFIKSFTSKFHSENTQLPSLSFRRQIGPPLL